MRRGEHDDFTGYAIKDKENEDLNSKCCDQSLRNLKIELVPVANQL